MTHLSRIDPDPSALREIASSCYEQNGHAVDWAAAKLASISSDHEEVEGCNEIQELSRGGDDPLHLMVTESSLQLLSNSINGQLVFNESLESETLQLYDVTGRPIQTSLGVSGNVVSLPGLTPGLYILQDVERGVSFRFFAH